MACYPLGTQSSRKLKTLTYKTMHTESRPGHEEDKSRLTEEERGLMKEKIHGGKAVLDEIEHILAGDGVDLSKSMLIEQHIGELEEDLRKLKQKGGKSFDEAVRVIDDIKRRANLQK